MNKTDRDPPQKTPPATTTLAGSDDTNTEMPMVPDEAIGTAEQITALESEVVDYKNRLLREMAAMENLRKRTQREKEDAARFAITRFAKDIVTISDNLVRAIDAVPEEARKGSDELVTNLVTGIDLTNRQLQQVFERHGVRRFDPQGEKFNPTYHEAIYEVPDQTQPTGTVGQVVESGYMIGERVLRPARVGVTSGGPKRTAEPPTVSPITSEPPAGPDNNTRAEQQSELSASQDSQPIQSVPNAGENIEIKSDRST